MHFYNRLSLRGKLLLMIGALSVLGFLLVIAYSTNRFANHAHNQGVATAQIEAEAQAEKVADQLKAAYRVTRSLATTFINLKVAGIVDRLAYDKVLSGILASQPQLLAVSSAWEPNALDGRDSDFANQPGHDATGRYIPYWNRGSGQVKLEPLVDYEKPGAGDYYLVPKQSKKPLFMEPYEYPVAGKPVLMTSLMTPLLQDGQFIGVVGVDFALSGFQQSLREHKPWNTGHLALLSNQGIWVANPDAAKIGKPAGEALPAAALAAVKAGQSYRYERDGWLYLLAPVKIDDMGNDWSLLVAVEEAQLLAEATAVRNTTLAVGLGCLLLALLLIGFVLQHSTRPLLDLAQTMQRLAGGSGDLTQRLPVNGADEIAQTARAFNQLMDNLQQMISGVKQQAAALSQELNALAGNTQIVAASSAQQSSAASATAATIEQVTVSISHIADNANETASLARNAGDLSGEAAAQVRATASEISRIATAVDELSRLLIGLGGRSQEISGIVNVIKEIADQTNLLALNAAIEAARAGEQGRGFAVVADEVRKLAERTARATVEIGQMIAAMQGETQQATAGMGAALDQVKRGVELSQQAEQAIGKIHHTTAQMVSKVGEIANATAEQSAASQDIAKHIESINAMSQQTDNAIRAASTATGELNLRANTLGQTVTGFRT